MCGLFTLKADPEVIAKHFGLSESPPLQPRFNIAPSQDVAVLKTGYEFSLLRWGLVPGWSKEPRANFSNINARAETVATSPAFRGAFRHHRCLMPADGFYEWSHESPKRPFHFRLHGGELFAFAAIWDRWDHGETLETCALLTTAANDVVAPVHARMPAILRPEDYDHWLDPHADLVSLHALLRPFDPGQMEGYPVSTLVNRPAVEDPRCVEPAVG